MGATSALAEILALMKAILAGFVVAVPIGAIGAMCLRRALQGRWVIGLAIGLGAAIADTILATAAMFGLTLLSRYFLNNQEPVLLVGGIFLILIGARMIMKRRPHLDAEDPSINHQLRSWRMLGGAIAVGFLLTIVNPATLIAFVGVFAGLGLFDSTPANWLRNWLVIIGAFSGSMLWWATLTGTAYLVRRHLSLEFVVVINVVLGVVVAGLGVASLLSVWGIQL
jgi:putative LysE/RhtB family amino acid efflux pump